jgi:succinoglycan biosynthesis transport protein ExoP
MRSSIKEFEEASAGDGELDVKGLGRAVAARGRLIGMVTLGVFAAALIFVMMVKPRYTGTAQVIVENQENYYTRSDRAQADPSLGSPDPEAIASQVQLVMSRDLARKAVQSLALKGNPEFDPQASGPSLAGPILTVLGMRRPEDAVAREDKILDNYFERLNVFSVTKSRVLQVEFTSWDPDLAAKAANQIADLYIEVQADAKRANARMAAASLATLITELRSKVAAAETRAEEYRAANGLLIGSNSLNMSGQQLADLSTQLTTARGAQAEFLAKSQLLRDMLRAGRISEIPDVANNDLVRRLAEQRVTLRSQLALESRTLLPGHPRIKDLTAQLAELETEIRAAGEKVARTLENDAKIAGARVVNLQSVLDQTKKSVSGASSEEARARELDREARVLREQLEASTARYQDALARQAAQSTPGDARIISRASAPQLPSYPKRVPIVLFATFAALILTTAGVLAAELLSGRAYLRTASGPVFRTEPAFTPEPAPPSAPQPLPPQPQPYGPTPRRTAPIFGAKPAAASAQLEPERVADAISGLAGRIAGRMTSGQASRILVTSGDPAVDGCQVALALGRALVADRRTILVDFCADPRADFSPRGLADLLAGTVTFEDAIHRDRGSRLHILPAGRGALSTSEAYWPVLEALSQTYDYVILLTPAVQTEGFAVDFASDCDFAVLASAPEQAEPEHSDAHVLLERAGATDILVIAEEEALERSASDVA